MHHKGNEFTLDPDSFKVADIIYATINGIRDGDVEDKFDWLVPVQSLVEA